STIAHETSFGRCGPPLARRPRGPEYPPSPAPETARLLSSPYPTGPRPRCVTAMVARTRRLHSPPQARPPRPPRRSSPETRDGLDNPHTTFGPATERRSAIRLYRSSRRQRSARDTSARRRDTRAPTPCGQEALAHQTSLRRAPRRFRRRRAWRLAKTRVARRSRLTGTLRRHLRRQLARCLHPDYSSMLRQFRESKVGIS